MGTNLIIETCLILAHSCGTSVQATTGTYATVHNSLAPDALVSGLATFGSFLAAR